MGCVCSCFRGSVTEEIVDVDDRSNKKPLAFLFQGIKNKFEALFGNEGMHAILSSDQGTPTVNTTPQTDAISASDSDASSNLPNSSSLGISQLQLNVQVNPVIVNGEAKLVSSIHEKDLKDDLSVSDVIVERAGVPKYMFPSSEELDECPTCLEEYTSENPKIFTQCQHCFHLPCIYEWMERSETCPVCMKLLTFSEQP